MTHFIVLVGQVLGDLDNPLLDDVHLLLHLKQYTPIHSSPPQPADGRSIWQW